MVDPLPFTPSAPNQTDKTFAKTLQDATSYNPRDYLLGIKKLPPWIFAAPHQHIPYSYGDTITISAGTSAPLDITIEADSYFLVETIQVVSDQGLTDPSVESDTLIQISDSSYNQPWSNRPVPLRDAAGFGGNPRELAYPNLLRPTSTVSINITNNSAVQQIYYVTYSGRKIYNTTEAEAVFLMRRQCYQYAIQVPLLTASQLGVKVPLQILGQSDFLIKRIYSYQGLHGASQAPTAVNWQIRDTTNDRYFFAQKINLRTVVGALITDSSPGPSSTTYYTYAKGFYYRHPLYVRRNAILEAEFDNLTSTAMPATFIVTFEGARLYDDVTSPNPALSS